MDRSRRPHRTAPALLVLLALACGGGTRLQQPEAPAQLPQVRLVLMVVVDQLGWDTLMRLEPLLTGGLRKMLDQGRVFANAHQLHAGTYTAPGHASLATGLHPRHHGIIANGWFDRRLGEEVNCVVDDDGTVSPRRLLSTTVADWVRAADERARVYTVSGKDRGAVLLGGFEADAAFWYDEGVFTSSSYYADAEPEWLASFHQEHPADSWFGNVWKPLPETLAASASVIVEPDEGDYPNDFPHPLGDATISPDDTFYEDLYASPISDVLVAELARTVVAEEKLGADEHLDFLGLSFSAMDAVGHDFGPHSVELVDTALRLDRTLGELLTYLEEHIGAEHLLVTLSADHGVAPLPEVRRILGLETRREGASEVACEQAVGELLRRRFGPGVRFDWPGYLDVDALAEAGIDEAAVLTYAAQLTEQCPQVARAWTSQELNRKKPPEAAGARARWRSFLAGRSPDLAITYQPWYVPLQVRRTTHGSPWSYDSHVPLVLLLPDRAGGRIDRAVGTVDLAPTLAALLALPRPAELDGVDLSDLALPGS